MERSKVYQIIDEEREYQDRRWNNSLSRSVGDFIVYMDEYMGKAKNAYTTHEGSLQALDMIRKVTALGVAMMERHGAPRRGDL